MIHNLPNNIVHSPRITPLCIRTGVVLWLMTLKAEFAFVIMAFQITWESFIFEMQAYM